jgi:L-serine dehydratase
MRVFEIIGPVMFGPSSSHIAGACRVARAMWQILGEDVREAHLELYGSFYSGNGHGLNKALVAGLLGYNTDDDRIHNCMQHVKDKGIKLTYEDVDMPGAHMNTVRYRLKGDHNSLYATGISVGGGMIQVINIDGAPVDITGDYHTFILFCKDAAALAPQVQSIVPAMEELKIETSASEDGVTQLVLVKSPRRLSEEVAAQLSALCGVVRTARHDMFD